MTNEELLAKIKAEIDLRYSEYREKMKTDDFTYYEGMADSLDLFEQFIDTLEEPVPADLEEAAEEWAENEAYGMPDAEFEMAYKGFIAGYKYHADHTHLPEDTVLFQKGVEEGKRLMMEEARLHFVLRVLSGNHMKKMIELYNDEVDCKPGDVVRAIIFKKED